MESEREQSEFNMAVSYLNRLNNLFYICDASAMELNSHQWYHTLLAIFRELSTEMKDKEIEEKEEEINLINRLLTQNNKTTSRTGKQMINPELYFKLHKFELFLRRIMKDSGLQNKMKDDPRFAIGG